MIEFELSIEERARGKKGDVVTVYELPESRQIAYREFTLCEIVDIIEFDGYVLENWTGWFSGRHDRDVCAIRYDNI